MRKINFEAKKKLERKNVFSKLIDVTDGATVAANAAHGFKRLELQLLQRLQSEFRLWKFIVESVNKSVASPQSDRVLQVTYSRWSHGQDS